LVKRDFELKKMDEKETLFLSIRVLDDRSLEMSESDSESTARTMEDLMSERETCIQWKNIYWVELREVEGKIDKLRDEWDGTNEKLIHWQKALARLENETWNRWGQVI
jgi:predicted  nucleic acid-binding Zn-ribbon protein